MLAENYNLLGRSAAADCTRRDIAEWPPHPDRVYQAMVASWGEALRSPEQTRALRWLECLPPPCLLMPEPVPQPDTFAPTAFVPVNDDAISKSKSSPPLRYLPIGRNRQARTFPRLPVEGRCHLWWPEVPAEEVQAHLPALRSLCLATASIGHSSSLVRLWADVVDAPPQGLQRYLPSEDGELSLRVPSRGRLDYLVETFADGGDGWDRPQPGRWQAYAHMAGDGTPAVARTCFSDRMIILRAVGRNARRYGVAHGPALADALRGAVMRQATDGSRTMELVSGHGAGNSGRLEEAHCAFVPLPFVGHQHADGHLLGMAIVLPAHLTPEERDGCETAFARCLNDDYRLRLTPGAEGDLELEPLTPTEARATLQVSTWCPKQGARTWATVTPIVLDRMPSRRERDPDVFMANEIASACERIGLPRPAAVDLSEVSFQLGAPHARQFPAMKRKSDGGNRWHVHAKLHWDRPVRGPVLLGAGRYRGYGFLKPFQEREAKP